MIKREMRWTLWVLALAGLSAASCSKLVEVSAPSNTVSSENVYESDATAIATVTNIYAAMSASTILSGGITSMNLFPGLSADEFSLFPGTTNGAVNYYYSNSLSNININNPDFWTAFYQAIYPVNAAIAGLSSAKGLTPAVKQQLTGEMLFMRGFCYFYLVNLYGDVPLITGTDYTANSAVSRTAASTVYQQIVADLKSAEGLLSTGYLNGTLLGASSERVRPTRWVAGALLARVYLYMQDYANAEAEANAVIGNSGLFQLVPLANVFLKNNEEAIWQLQPVNAGWNTEDARLFLLPASGPNQGGNPVFLSPQLMGSFESGDQRLTYWVSMAKFSEEDIYYYPAKYKNAVYNNPVTEYETVFRLGEQYLIRAEARVQQGNIGGAQADLDTVRSRAGLGVTIANDRSSLLTAILHERQVELFSEWGHRWLDLKRTGTVDAVMSVVTPQKGGSWNTDWKWYPITRNELQLNSKLTQNQGY